MNLLFLREQPIAFTYNYHYNGRVYGMRKGFDPEFSRFRPGLVLQKKILQNSFSGEDTFYDMGVAYMDSKRPWQTTQVTSHRLTHFPPAVARAQLIRLKRWLSSRLLAPRVASGT